MKGITQAQLAEMAGTTRSSIARLESGRRDPSLSYLRRVLAALGYDICLQPVPLSEAQKAAPA
jgi:transcriptional regulator with XRE-family HTH domain